MSTTIGISLYKKPLNYVKQCVDSALGQTAEVEVILRTDGPESCDAETLEFLREKSKEVKNFTLIEGEVNLGIYGSYRKIFENVETDNLCQLDADDYLHPEAIEICERVLNIHKEYSMVYTDCMEIDSNGKELELCYRQKIPYNQETLRTEFITYHLRVIRSIVYDSVGGYDETLSYGGDYDLSLRISEIGVERNIGYIPIPLYYYRRDENCHSLTDGILDSNRDCYKALCKSIRRCGESNALKGIINLKSTEIAIMKKVPESIFKKLKTEKSQPILLTGMHRSFTSLTSNILMELGIYMGESILSPDVFNPEGYFENVDFLNLDRTMCSFSINSELSFDDWGWAADTKMNEDKLKEFEECAKKLVFDRRRMRVWGWKDPRSSLLLDFWDNIIPYAKYIFVYRHPAEVYTSVSNLKGIDIFQKHPEYIEQCWRDHNENIVNFARKNRDRCLVISTNNLVQNPNAIKPLLQEKLGLHIYDENLENVVFSEHIRSKRDGVQLSRSTLDLYNELEELNELF